MQGQLEGFKNGAVVLLVATEVSAVAPDAEVRLAEVVELDTPAKEALDDFLKVCRPVCHNNTSVLGSIDEFSPQCLTGRTGDTASYTRRDPARIHRARGG